MSEEQRLQNQTNPDLSAQIERAREAWLKNREQFPERYEISAAMIDLRMRTKVQNAARARRHQTLDVATALSWVEDIRHFQSIYPRAAYPSEIRQAYEQFAGRYRITQAALPIETMHLMKLSVFQWQEVFHWAEKIKDREDLRAGYASGPPPYNLFLKLAESKVALRRSIEIKMQRLSAARRGELNYQPVDGP